MRWRRLPKASSMLTTLPQVSVIGLKLTYLSRRASLLVSTSSFALELQWEHHNLHQSASFSSVVDPQWVVSLYPDEVGETDVRAPGKRELELRLQWGQSLL